MSKLNFFLAGKNNIACEILDFVLKNFPQIQVFAIANKNDPGVHGWQQSLRKLAQDRKVPLVSIDDAYLHEDAIFLSLEFDTLVDIKKFRTQNIYNIHFSLLPAYKGMYTSALPILHGVKKTGVTLHKIDAGIDTGPIIDQLEIPLNENITCGELYDLYIKKGTALVKKNIGDILFGKPKAKQQDFIGSSYFSKKSIDYKKIIIDLNKTAIEIKRQIHAFVHRHYQLPRLAGKFVVKAEVAAERSKCKAGEIVEENELYFKVASIDYDLIVYKDKLVEILNFCKDGAVKDIKARLNNLAHINDKNDRGWSPLIVAAYYNNKDVVQFLLNYGADPNDKNYKGTTALMYAKDGALRTRDRTSFRLLLEHGASLDARDYEGKRLFDYLNEEEKNFLGLNV